MAINRIIYFFIIAVSLICSSNVSGADNEAPSTKKERNRITKGNALYEEGKYRQAIEEYKLALQENPNSVVARYNMGLSEVRVGMNPNDTSQTAKNILQTGIKDLQQIANLGKKRTDLASKANYNLGNVAFNSQDYQKAVDYYKQALRLNPSDNDARRNLRIAQLKIQNQDQNQNQDQDKQQDQEQDKDKDKQDQDQDQNQDQNQDRNDNKDEQQDQNQDQNQQQQPQIDQQAAEQILNAIENKENQTRARVAGQNAEKSRQRNRNRLNW